VSPRRAIVAVLASVLPAASAFPAHAGAAPAAPRPQVLLIHGGGWFKVGPAMQARMAGDEQRLRSWGYATQNLDYAPGGQAFLDVLDAYDRTRARVGSATPICLLGASAGAQMALMVAIRRPDVACVISHAAPTRLAALRPRLRRNAHAAFDWLGGLDEFSPARYRPRTPILLEHALADPVVDFADAQAMHAAAPRSRLILLPPGPVRWTHASVDAAAVAQARHRERRFLARWTHRPPAAR
jgi:fermentation-respiration switch protein FrsA (DUF1100 family)